jgi:mannosyltransferase OCH1-like enzyme
MISNLHNNKNMKFNFQNKKEKLKTNLQKFVYIYKKLKISYPFKSNYNSVIPFNIFQTWHSKELPPLMNRIVEKIKVINPEFFYHLFDDNDCREFIKNNFEPTILNAYDSLIPGAYKADLWRYCVLFIKGGIYLDIKYAPINNFKFINLTEAEHWVLDVDKNNIYNALIVCKPNNPILLAAINKIVENVKNKFYGNSSLEPTGPKLLSLFFTNEQKNQFDMYHDFYMSFENRFIYLNNYLVLKSYNGYITEHNNNKRIDHYSDLWKKKNIYK